MGRGGPDHRLHRDGPSAAGPAGPHRRDGRRAAEERLVSAGHAFVAGGTSGINLAIAHRYASEGWAVSVLSRSQDKVDAAVTELARSAGAAVNFSLSCAFGCPIEGDVPQAAVLAWCERAVDEIGAHGVTLCDTTGMAYPTQVLALVSAFRARWPQTELTLHFHNTRGMGLANVLAAIDAGADRFDASLGGIGGCPYAPGATGNVCSEEVVHALGWMGYETGVDLSMLLGAARRLQGLIGREVPSQLLKAGTRLEAPRTPASPA
ncbi:MAG: SDR family NAD(P)-dependent oxidoreductase [Variovorax sp.]|nr:MAG: SDR family NAD(P)-dependent oxidoreductase [Variovorax sp.]